MTETATRFVKDAIAESGRLLLVLAGSNGAGKSTFFTHFLAGLGLRFVNADLLARELHPEDPSAVAYEAAALADQERRQLVELGESFCMETVFSDPEGDKLRFLEGASANGYRVLLIFIGIDGPELSQARVAQRVSEGGHDVPDEKLLSRFPRTIENLKLALRIVDDAILLDNSSLALPYTQIARYEQGKVVQRMTGPYPAWAKGLPGLS